jgi:hypothetical protein
MKDVKQSEAEKIVKRLSGWNYAELFLEIAMFIIKSFESKVDIVEKFDSVISSLLEAVNTKDVRSIEHLAVEIEGTDEDDSYLTQSCDFERESRDWYLYGVLVSYVYEAINKLYIDGELKNIPSCFKEQFPEAFSESLKLAEKCGIKDSIISIVLEKSP